MVRSPGIECRSIEYVSGLRKREEGGHGREKGGQDSPNGELGEGCDWETSSPQLSGGAAPLMTPATSLHHLPHRSFVNAKSFR